MTDEIEERLVMIDNDFSEQERTNHLALHTVALKEQGYTFQGEYYPDIPEAITGPARLYLFTRPKQMINQSE